MVNTLFKALSHPDRRKILALLKEGPMPAGDLADHFDSAWPTISRHLNVLKEADLISAERQGTTIFYRANSSVLEDAAAALLSLTHTKDRPDHKIRKQEKPK